MTTTFVVALAVAFTPAPPLGALHAPPPRAAAAAAAAAAVCLREGDSRSKSREALLPDLFKVCAWCALCRVQQLCVQAASRAAALTDRTKIARSAPKLSHAAKRRARVLLKAARSQAMEHCARADVVQPCWHWLASATGR